MPSKKPSLQITLEPETFAKLEYIQAATRRSKSNLGRYIVEQYIAAYEQEHGVITVPDPHELGGGK